MHAHYKKYYYFGYVSNYVILYNDYVIVSGTPKHIDYEAVKADLVDIDGVKHAHSLQIWSLTLNKTALAVHLALGQWGQ